MKIASSVFLAGAFASTVVAAKSNSIFQEDGAATEREDGMMSIEGDQRAGRLLPYSSSSKGKKEKRRQEGQERQEREGSCPPSFVLPWGVQVSLDEG